MSIDTEQREAIIFDGEELLVAVEPPKKELIERILNESRLNYYTLWQSKYNDYVRYDYEPFCIDGFIANYFITNENKNILKFYREIISNLLKNIAQLERCYKLESKNTLLIYKEQ